jgi:ZIP family zinc transporter/zinc and cadmium transporter
VNAALFALAAAGAALLGAVAVTRHARRGLAFIELCLCFSAGFMIALAVVEAIPEALALDARTAAPIVLLGYVLVHLTQHTLAPHFHFGEETHAVSAATRRSAIIGLALHTFFDGVAIASGFLVTPALGMLFFVAIALHKIPEGVAVASLVLASGGTARASYRAAGLMGIATVLGALLTGSIGVLSRHGLALSAGVMVYVGASNLVPEFQQRRGWKVPLAFVGGSACFLAARAALERVGG